MIEKLRAWARQHTGRARYSPVGIAFHWTMAFLILFQLGWGWYASMLPVGGSKLGAYQVHSEMGLLILILAILRMVWRLMIPGPVNDADFQGLQTKIANVTKYIFYICFFGLPLSGWAMWSSVAEPGLLSVGGIIPWPQLPFFDLPPTLQWAIMDWSEDVHHVLILTLAVLIPLHIAAALKHHFWDRHDVLRGILPEIPDEKIRPEAKKHRQRGNGPRPLSTGG